MQGSLCSIDPIHLSSLSDTFPQMEVRFKFIKVIDKVTDTRSIEELMHSS